MQLEAAIGIENSNTRSILELYLFMFFVLVSHIYVHIWFIPAGKNYMAVYYFIDQRLKLDKSLLLVLSE